MRKIGYSVCSVFLLILSAVLFVICCHIPTSGNSNSGSSALPVLFIPLAILFEFYIKIQDLFKSDFSYRRTLLVIWVGNALTLFLIIICGGDETSVSLKIKLLSLILPMAIPDLILTIKLLKDRAKEKRLREKK